MVNYEIPSMFCFINRMCGYVWVPEDVGVLGRELMMFGGASVGEGIPAAEVVVKL